MRKFRITYDTWCDGIPSEHCVIEDIEDSPELPAHEVADDFGYSLADKGRYVVQELIEVKPNVWAPKRE